MCAENADPHVEIDLMVKKDLPEVLAIENESFASPWTIGMFQSELSAVHSQFLVARIKLDNKSIIGGYIIFWIVADEVHLHNLAVKEEYRCSGLGFHLLAAMKQISQQIGARAMTLEVRESNSAAIKLYRRCSFVVKGRRPHYYTDTHEDALIMWADVK